MYKKSLLVLAFSLLVSACSIQQSIEPAEIPRSSELCIIENPEVRAGFLREFTSVLDSKGVAYRVVKHPRVPSSCVWTANYVAKWSWDLALYMSYAEIKIYRNKLLEGKALYDSTRGGANMGKFIDAETKIRELVDELMQSTSASLFIRTYG